MDLVSPKEWASSKRSHRFGGQENVRKAEPNGHTIRKVIDPDRFRGGSVTKLVKNCDEPNVHTEFENRLGVDMNVDCSYSLNRRKRWQIIDDCIKTSSADEVWCVPVGRTVNKEFSPKDWQSTTKDRTLVAYFGIESLREDFLRRHGSVQDVHRDHPWLTQALIPPKNVSTPRIRFKSLTSSSHIRHTIVSRARVENFDTNAYWAPKVEHNHADSETDCLDVDLGEYHKIEAVSTRGRPIRRLIDEDYEAVRGWPLQFVRRYHLWYKRRRNHAWRKYSDVLVGNVDAETEVANVLIDPYTQTVGLNARFLRFQPLSYVREGWSGAKAMRVGVYGEAVNEDVDRIARAESSHSNKTISSKQRRRAKAEPMSLKVTTSFSVKMQTRESDSVPGDVSTSMDSSDESSELEEDRWRVFTSPDATMASSYVSAAVICVTHTRQGRHTWGKKGEGPYFGGVARFEQKWRRQVTRSKRFKLRRDAMRQETCLDF